VEPWEAKLRQGDPEAAWDLFIGRYRRLIVATIRHYVQDHDEVMDVFGDVCQSLSANNLAQLRRYVDQPTRSAQFSTWLLAVVRNRTIDHLRHRAGRRRVQIPETLSSLQRRIFECVFVHRRSHIEAYEVIRTSLDPDLSFGTFLKEVAATYRAASLSSGEREWREPDRALAAADAVCPADDVAEAADASARVTSALETLEPDVRLAVQLYVVHEMPAADVARAVGWPSAKAVYNRVYRALAALRVVLERQGVRRGDL
jgi:RNA polymerase sigma factor (sigma-70 family)